MTEDQRNERRLAYEAQTVFLGHLTHPDVVDGGFTEHVKVEVSFIRNEDDPEGAGHLHVVVPLLDPEGMDVDEMLAAHPANLAAETAQAWGEQRYHGYFSVDEVYAL